MTEQEKALYRANVALPKKGFGITWRISDRGLKEMWNGLVTLSTCLYAIAALLWGLGQKIEVLIMAVVGTVLIALTQKI